MDFEAICRQKVNASIRYVQNNIFIATKTQTVDTWQSKYAHMPHCAMEIFFSTIKCMASITAYGDFNTQAFRMKNKYFNRAMHFVCVAIDGIVIRIHINTNTDIEPGYPRLYIK